jgi:septal ring factor EnvC (AmiA/AmiB activator)
MNLVGKIFTALIFVMCIVFATFSLMVHAGHKNWRDEYVKLVAQLNKSNEEKATLQQAYKQLDEQRKNDNERSKEQIGKLQFANDQLTKANIDAQTKNNQLQGDLRKFAADFKLVQQNLADLRDEADSLRSAIKVAVVERQKIFTNLVNTTTDNTNHQNDINRLEQRLRDVVDKFQTLQQQLAYASIRPADMVKDPPPISGMVTGFPRGGGQSSDVEISLGYDDGVRPGHRFSVTSSKTGQYVGDVQVVQVPNPNRAVARPVKETMREQIQKYDHVQANLSKRR